MSIEKDYDAETFTLICDDCGEEITHDGLLCFNEFNECVDYKKQNGWKSKKDKDGWMDLCPKCQ